MDRHGGFYGRKELCAWKNVVAEGRLAKGSMKNIDIPSHYGGIASFVKDSLIYFNIVNMAFRIKASSSINSFALTETICGGTVEGSVPVYSRLIV